MTTDLTIRVNVRTAIDRALRLALHGQIILLYLPYVSLSRSLRPQSSSLYEVLARALVVLDVDGCKDQSNVNTHTAI